MSKYQPVIFNNHNLPSMAGYCNTHNCVAERFDDGSIHCMHELIIQRYFNKHEFIPLFEATKNA